MGQKKPNGGSQKKNAAGRRTPTPTKKLRAAAGDETALESAAVSGPASGPLVLVVDDYQDAREMCCEYLTYCGFRVAEACNGQEAIERATALLPDLILMDLSLPGMDGWEATRRLKASDKTRKIPIVALTGHALAGHSEGAKAAGCDAFITKPCMPDALVAEVRRMLEGGSKTKSRRGSGR